jgi:cytochrome c oxidase subunit 3
MPATFTPRPQIEIERKDPGFGGKPPVDKRPTGGGGEGDSGDDRFHRGRGPRELLQRYRLGLLFMLAGDLMFFVAIVSAFFVRQTSGHFDPRGNYTTDWRPMLLPTVLWANTAILLSSSITVEFARRHLFSEMDVLEEWLGLGRPAARRALPWLIATLALGMAFLAGQWFAWNQLEVQGVFFASNPNSYFFYLITGSHALHLIVGLLGLSAAIFGLYRLKRIEMRQILVDCAAWYWHTMGAFWVFLFVLLVYFQ